MKIIIDDKIPYIKGVFEPYAEVIYKPGAAIKSTDVKDADAMVVRTRTRCDRSLLEGSKVRMIATATIGYDHIDTDFCEQNNIEWTNAPGCNSGSVAQYILAALFYYAREKHVELSDLTLGVIGVGNVGSKVAKLADLIGMKVLLNDPPRERKEGKNNFVDLKTIQQQADIITVHTPLTQDGPDKTFHLVDDAFINKCKKKFVFINSARGEIMETEAVNKASDSGKITSTVIDCWENEPHVDDVMLQHAFISTPHIAGYSKDGKANGTSMSVQAISRKFNLGLDEWVCTEIEQPENPVIEVKAAGKSCQELVSEVVLQTYPIWGDTQKMKLWPENFESQRGAYWVRREFPAFTITSRRKVSCLRKLSLMGFKMD